MNLWSISSTKIRFHLSCVVKIWLFENVAIIISVCLTAQSQG